MRGKVVAMLCGVALFAWLVFSTGPTLEPIPHADLEAILYDTLVAAETHDGVAVHSAWMSNDLTYAYVGIRSHAPSFEAEIRERFGHRIAFEYGPGPRPIICGFPESEHTPDFCRD